MNKFVLSKTDVRRELDLSEDQLDRLIEAKLIETVKIGARQMFTRAAVTKFVASTTGA